MIVSICSLCAYANTCFYGDIRVTLQQEKVEVRDNYPNGVIGMVYISVNDTKATEVRVLVECRGQRKDITVKLINGEGSFDACEHFSGIKKGDYCPIKLLNVPEMCF